MCASVKMVAWLVLMVMKLILAFGLNNAQQNETGELLSIVGHLKKIGASDVLTEPWIKLPPINSDEINSVFPDYEGIQPRSGLLDVMKKVARKFMETEINHLPTELHLPGYHYCGPGTKLSERLTNGDPGINELDEACRDHDIAYLKYEDLKAREAADRKLVNVAQELYQKQDLSLGERIGAFFVSKIMGAKINLLEAKNLIPSKKR